MSFPQFSMRELLDAGVHFGHKTKRWNPRMAPYLYGVRNDVHIIDLQKTVPLLHQALLTIKDTVAKNGKILFVGTKRQAAEPVAEAAKRCGQFYVNQRWLGGMLTNWHTIQASIKTLRKLDEQLEEGGTGLTKKELLSIEREKAKLERSLGGIKDMRGVPDLLIIIDINKDDIAVQEAQRLGIPIIAVLDSNSSPDGISFPVPGNDDSTRAIKLYCQLFSDAALSGISESLSASGVDIGESEDPAAVLKQSEREKADAAAQEKEKRTAGRKGKDKEEKAAKKAPVVMKKGEARGAAAKKTSDEESAESVAEETAADDANAASKKTAAKKPTSSKTKKAS